jgi:hypothetical protein
MSSPTIPFGSSTPSLMGSISRLAECPHEFALAPDTLEWTMLLAQRRRMRVHGLASDDNIDGHSVDASSVACLRVAPSM